VLYHAHVAAEEAEVAAAAERARATEAEAARAAVEAAQPSIRRRQELIEERKQARAQREQEEAAAAAARETRLEALRALVVPAVERDPTRVLLPTAASAAEDSSHNPLFSVHGYDMTELLRDQRFRLQLALFDRGLHASEYGRAAVASMQPATQPRLDAIKSNIFPQRAPG